MTDDLKCACLMAAFYCAGTSKNSRNLLRSGKVLTCIGKGWQGVP